MEIWCVLCEVGTELLKYYFDEFPGLKGLKDCKCTDKKCGEKRQFARYESTINCIHSQSNIITPQTSPLTFCTCLDILNAKPGDEKI